MTQPHFVLISGSRKYRGLAVCEQLDLRLASYGENLFVIHGACPSGVDRLAELWCQATGVQSCACAANWRVHDNPAGPIRNWNMLKLWAFASRMLCSYSESGEVLCFPCDDSVGTRDMIRACRSVDVEPSIFELGKL